MRSHCGLDDAPTPTTNAAGRAEDPTLLTSLSAKLDRNIKQLRQHVFEVIAPATEGVVEISGVSDLEGITRMASEPLFAQCLSWLPLLLEVLLSGNSESAGPSVVAIRKAQCLIGYPASFTSEDHRPRKQPRRRTAMWLSRKAEKLSKSPNDANWLKNQCGALIMRFTQHADDPIRLVVEAFNLLFATPMVWVSFHHTAGGTLVLIYCSTVPLHTMDSAVHHRESRSISGHGVVVVDKLPDDEIVDPRVKVETIPDSAASPPRSRRKHRGVRSDDSLWDKPVEDFFSLEMRENRREGPILSGLHSLNIYASSQFHPHTVGMCVVAGNVYSTVQAGLTENLMISCICSILLALTTTNGFMLTMAKKTSKKRSLPTMKGFVCITNPVDVAIYKTWMMSFSAERIKSFLADSSVHSLRYEYLLQSHSIPVDYVILLS
ncbi:hypothetical protein Tco_0976429 [Tanacetum coccineum]|uniref:Uncharacterized protein n=1 Tax=Tanacetum coccineum TaxID=301880 RepID=A0ABQ5EHN8_9ASTR